jgi:hypothetical protein
VIIEWLLDFIETALVWLGGLFPDVDLSGFTSGWGLVLGYLGDLNYFLPIAEVFAVTIAVFMVFPALMGVSLVAWLIALIRGGSSRG